MNYYQNLADVVLPASYRKMDIPKIFSPFRLCLSPMFVIMYKNLHSDWLNCIKFYVLQCHQLGRVIVKWINWCWFSSYKDGYRENILLDEISTYANFHSHQLKMLFALQRHVVASCSKNRWNKKLLHEKILRCANFQDNQWTGVVIQRLHMYFITTSIFIYSCRLCLAELLCVKDLGYTI